MWCGPGVPGGSCRRHFAPWPTVYWYFTWWHDDGTVERIHDALREAGVRPRRHEAPLVELRRAGLAVDSTIVRADEHAAGACPKPALAASWSTATIYPAAIFIWSAR